MTLHDRIMALEPRGEVSSITRINFVDARNRAALIASEADNMMQNMAAVLDLYAELEESEGEAASAAKNILADYDKWRSK